jgi:hypothetical protein
MFNPASRRFFARYEPSERFLLLRPYPREPATSQTQEFFCEERRLGQRRIEDESLRANTFVFRK